MPIKLLCKTCNGSGQDFEHQHTDGTHAACETCDGYGTFDEVIKHHRSTHSNPLYSNPGAYSEYEIRTIREYQSPSGDETYVEIHYNDPKRDGPEDYAIGSVMYGIYGHIPGHGFESICDCTTLELAYMQLRRFGVVEGLPNI